MTSDTSWNAELVSAGLKALLEAHHPDASSISVKDFKLIPGGYSRITGQFRAEIDGSLLVCVTRSDPVGSKVDESDRDVEWEFLSTMTASQLLPIPRAQYFDYDGRYLGTKTIISEFVEGRSLLALAESSSPEQKLHLSDVVADTLSTIHSVDVHDLPTRMQTALDWNTYISAILEDISSSEAASVEKDPFIRYMLCWLYEHLPHPMTLGLVHGDFQHANILVQDEGLPRVIDWERVHIGDPREDLGWFKAHEPDLIGVDENRFYKRYRHATGLSEEIINPFSVRHFAVLSSVRSYARLLAQISEFTKREGSGVRIPFLTGALTASHARWWHAVKEYELLKSTTEGGLR